MARVTTGSETEAIEAAPFSDPSLSSPLPPRSRASSRVTGLDAARVLATLGVVWVHTAEIQHQPSMWSTLGRFGTSFYAIAAIFLAARAHFLRSGTTTWDVAKRRGRRLLVPFAIWSALYAAFYFSTMYPQGHPVDVITRYWGPFFGTAPHLWFLPFAFLAGVLASALVPRLMKLPGPVLIVGGLILTLGLYVYVYGWGYLALPQRAITRIRLHRLARWTEEAPMVFGAIFGCAIYGKYLGKLSKLGKRKRHRLAWASLVAFVAVQASYSIFLEDLGSIFWNRVRFFSQAAGAFWLIAFVAARDGKWIQKLAPLGRATYFAYLAHQMVLDSVKLQLSKLPHYGTMPFAIASTLGIFGVCVGLGMLVSRVRLLRWLSP